MNITIPINYLFLEKISRIISKISPELLVGIVALVACIIATIYFYLHGTITAYGDAESHLDIAKRVVNGLTPGAAQLGGIWLPLPHIMMIPFVVYDFLWRTGLAGAIVSGICFVISTIYVYKVTYLVTKQKIAGYIATLVFLANPNILYMQSTPMTELPLIVFFILSSYYFISYIFYERRYLLLILAGIFGFCATLSRYDGWFLVVTEATTLFFMHLHQRYPWKKLEGRLILFSTPAFFGIVLWLCWGFLILGDPLYFTHSEFSARSQQQSWFIRDELPGNRHLLVSLLYYAVTAMSNSGLIVFILSCIGIGAFLWNHRTEPLQRLYIWIILFAPFIFNVLSLFLGISVIFIPDITPTTYEWTLFNVRYGILMLPAFAFFVGYLFYRARPQGKLLILFLIIFQIALFRIGYSRNIVLADGTVGLSATKHPQAEEWIAKHYDYGLVLLDDYARTISVLKSSIPMQRVIYVGTKPYWTTSLVHPQTYARWIIMQRDDDVWKHMYENPAVRLELYKYFQKVYTSPEILIFKRNGK